MLSSVVQAQCDGNRYRNLIFPDVIISSDLQYGNNTDMTGAPVDLLMDVYEPDGDALSARPLVIMCHGGFFIGGDKAAPDVAPLCLDLARMGYVVASINYRMGVPVQPDVDNTFAQAVMRAVQDLNAAVRWFRMDASVNGNSFRIDPDNIFTFGTSAGGFMTLQQAYMDEDEIPSFLDTSAPGLTGGVEGNSGNPGYSTTVKGIISHCGAMGDNAWIDADEQTPACLFHGENDNTVPIDSTMFTLLGIVPVAVTEGSIPISERMTALGIEHCLEINDNADHVAYMSNQAIYDTTLSITSNFLSHLVCGIELDCSYRELLTDVAEKSAPAWSLYPNPADDMVYIRTGRSSAHWNVYDALGANIMEGSGSTITTAALAAGIYYVKLWSAETPATISKIVIRHD